MSKTNDNEKNSSSKSDRKISDDTDYLSEQIVVQDVKQDVKQAVRQDVKQAVQKIVTNEVPQIIKLMQGSMILNALYEYVIKIVSGKVDQTDFLNNKDNVKMISIGIGLFFASFLIGMMSHFLFYVMFFFSSLKCILWLFECYEPDMNSDESVDLISNRYVSETSPTDVLEYYVVPIFIVLVIQPMSYIPLPFVSLLVHGGSVMLGLASMSNKAYRQKICLFIRDSFTNRKDGKYVPSQEGEVHRLLQTLCYTIECINLSAFNITHNPRSVYDKLNGTSDLVNGMAVLTSKDHTNITNTTNTTNQADNLNNMNNMQSSQVFGKTQRNGKKKDKYQKFKDNDTNFSESSLNTSELEEHLDEEF